MQEVKNIIKDLKILVNEEDLENIENYLSNNIENIFNNSDLSDIYHLIKDIEWSKLSNTLSKLTVSWLAFLCGDNAKSFTIYNSIIEKDLKTEKQSSLYYSLKALVSSMLGEPNAIKYAKLSIDILPEDEISLFMANARLTYGQLLSGSDQYRSAANMFEKSFNIFKTLNLDFL